MIDKDVDQIVYRVFLISVYLFSDKTITQSELHLLIVSVSSNIDSSLKQIRFKNPQPQSSMSSMVTANSLCCSLSSDFGHVQVVTALCMHKVADFYSKLMNSAA